MVNINFWYLNSNNKITINKLFVNSKIKIIYKNLVENLTILVCLDIILYRESFYICVCSYSMTFRPSDDVLEQQSADAQLSNTLENIGYSEWVSSQWERLFFNANEEEQFWNNSQDGSYDAVNELVGNSPVEEIKSPDLSELLKSGETGNSTEVRENVVEENKQVEQDFTIDLSEIQSTNSQGQDVIENNQQSIVQDVEDQCQDIQIQDQNTLIQGENNSIQDVNNQVQNEGNPIQIVNDPVLNLDNHMQEMDNQSISSKSSDEEVVIDGKMRDSERINIVSWIEWSIHSNLDLLVDDQWSNVVKNYKKMHRIIFKRWIFIFATLLWISAWVFVQARANQFGKINIINDSLIENNFSNKFIVTDLSEWDWIDVIIPYGFSKINWREFITKSNLVSYKWIILPQNAFVDVKSDKIISLKDFEIGDVSRIDLETLLSTLVKNNSINKKIKDFPSVLDYKWQWQALQWWLTDNFSLWCMFTTKVSNKICDKFLDIFYKYGKYYNISSSESDLLKLTKEIKNQGESIVPICDMVNEYVLHSEVVPSDVLGSVMSYCDEEHQSYYKKLAGFIDVENSLWQPELSDKVFDDPDLNAYKLLSAWQNIHKILEWTSINEGFIISYLNFVQNLIDKNKWSYNYLWALYVDLLYVFNTDELYSKLLKRGGLTSDIKLKMDQINNWNFLLKHESLLSHLTTPNIIASGWEFTDSFASDKTLDDLISQYYSMKDRLTIRLPNKKISDTQLQVRTEIYSDVINAVVGDSLKATILLYRADNVLYVEKINISWQPALSQTLNEDASRSELTLYDMLWDIDENVTFWYKEPVYEAELNKSLCEQLRENANIVVYSCDDSDILLYGWDSSIEYSFTLKDWILQSFSISDKDLYKAIKEKSWKILFNKDNTPTIIQSIIEFELDTVEEDDSIEKKLQVLDQFMIHLKVTPEEISSIEWEDSIFLVEFDLGEFTLRWRYNVDTHLLTKISYYECEKTLEIRNLAIEVSANNEAQLKEILNNPRIFLTKANPAAFQKYQKMCD